MSTRSGLPYHSETAGTMANREEGAGPMAVTMGDVLKFLAESQERQAIEERRREQERERKEAEEKTGRGTHSARGK